MLGILILMAVGTHSNFVIFIFDATRRYKAQVMDDEDEFLGLSPFSLSNSH